MKSRCIIRIGTAAAVALVTAPGFADSPGSDSILALEAGKPIALDVGDSKQVRAPWWVTRIAVTDPKIADVEVLGPDRVLVMARSLGSTDLVMWSQDDEVQQTQVKVDVDLSQLQADLAELFPTAALRLKRSKNVIAVSGSLSRTVDVESLHRFLEATEINYVDMTSLAGVQQVELEVRVAEVSRNALRELGIDTTIRGTTAHGRGQFFPLIGEDFGTGTIGPTTGLLDLRAGFTHADLEILVDALAENQYLKILAEPNLTALSGEEASFLAGGEFPILVPQSGITANGAAITVEYKQFGVGLVFRPIVLGDGRIRLKVGTEVSDITDAGSVEIQGTRIPGIVTRRAETTLQMGSGQTFAMAGLIQQNVEANNARQLFLGDLPILGPLFRSVRYSRGETELVVLVRASLVEPQSIIAKDIPLPGDLHEPPTDVELFGEGRLERTPSTDLASPDATWRQALGIDPLKGPGMWTRYGTPIARSRATIQVRSIESEDSQQPTGEKSALGHGASAN